MDVNELEITCENGRVVIVFPYNISAVGMSPQDARDIAALLISSSDAAQRQAQTEEDPPA